MMLNENDIIARLGVTRPVLMIERAEIVEETIKTSFLLKEDLFFWKSHFLNNPTMPGTYMLEMLAQSAALLDMELSKSSFVPIITSINNVRFLREVKPNSILTAEVTIKSIIEGAFYTSLGKLFCGEKSVCKAEMMHVVKRIN